MSSKYTTSSSRSSNVCMDRHPAHTIYILLHCLAGGGNLSLYDGWRMKRASNDDILNCAGPINRAKVTLISGVVRDDCCLEKVARSHQCICFLYNTRLVLKAEVEPPWTAEHFLWWKAVYNYILCVTVRGWFLNCQYLRWYYDLRSLKMKNVFFTF